MKRKSTRYSDAIACSLFQQSIVRIGLVLVILEVLRELLPGIELKIEITLYRSDIEHDRFAPALILDNQFADELHILMALAAISSHDT